MSGGSAGARWMESRIALDLGLGRRGLARRLRGVDHEPLPVDVEDPHPVALAGGHVVGGPEWISPDLEGPIR